MNLLELLKRYIGIISLIMIDCFIAIKVAWTQPYQQSKTRNPNIHFNKISNHDINIHYASAGDASKLGLIFIHGTPGGWAAFEGYLANPALQKYFFMVSVDRPGWGKSLTSDKALNGQFDHQARSIAAVMAQFTKKKWIIIGYSLGASLAPQVVLQTPNSVSALLLLAGSLKPKLGSPRWYNYAAKTWVVSKLVGRKMTQSNREIMILRKQLSIMSSSIEGSLFDTNIIILQGLKDKLVSPKNPAYALENWQDNFSSIKLIELKDAGHFIPWQESDDVINAIIELANMNPTVNQ